MSSYPYELTAVEELPGHPKRPPGHRCCQPSRQQFWGPEESEGQGGNCTRDIFIRPSRKGLSLLSIVSQVPLRERADGGRGLSARRASPELNSELTAVPADQEAQARSSWGPAGSPGQGQSP